MSLGIYHKIVADMRLQVPERQLFLAGGAVRDTIMGKSVKDLDVFIHAHTLEDFQVSCKRLDREYGTSKTERDVIAEYRTWHHEIVGVRDYVINGLDVQVIGFDVPNFSLQAILDKIDYGICRVGLDELGGIYTTPEFREDRRNSIFTLHYVGQSGLAPSIRRFARLSAKYPTWGVAVVDGFKLPDDTFDDIFTDDIFAE